MSCSYFSYMYLSDYVIHGWSLRIQRCNRKKLDDKGLTLHHGIWPNFLASIEVFAVLHSVRVGINVTWNMEFLIGKWNICKCEIQQTWLILLKFWGSTHWRGTSFPNFWSITMERWLAVLCILISRKFGNLVLLCSRKSYLQFSRLMFTVQLNEYETDQYFLKNLHVL